MNGLLMPHLMNLASIATALPERSWTQRECWDDLRDAPAVRGLKPRSRGILEGVLLGDSGIERRHFAVENVGDVFARNAQGLNEAFELEAARLGSRALMAALAKADVGTVDALFVCTCTGYLCPGLSSHIAESVGLSPSVGLMDLTGAGCGAAIPAMRAASNHLAANPGHRVAVVAVEICSAAFYVDDDPGVLISLALFGDGAAAVVLDGRTDGEWRLGDFRSLHLPSEREKVRFVNRDGKLCNQLHRAVPEVAAQAVADLYPGANGHAAPQIISHAGGRNVLSAIRTKLPGHALADADAVLRDCGNMSSPSVLFAAERALAGNGSTPDHLWLVSFGAGFACHSCSLDRSGSHSG
ncbi:MAG: stilbene synthase [Chthoniobacteraceae bacterium]